MALSDQVAAVFQFHCLQCHTLLSVPTRAIGLSVRCPGCGQSMTVPKSDAAFEESVSEWIAEDVAELWEEEDEVIDDRVEAMLDAAEPPAEATVTIEPGAEPLDLPVAALAAPPPRLPRPAPSLPRAHARLIRLFQ